MWPVPVLGASAIALSVGMAVMIGSRSGPDTQGPLDVARRLLERNEGEAAIEVLNNEFRPVFGVAEQEQRAEFFVLRAQAFSRGQDRLGLDLEENHVQIVEDYLQAEALRAELQGEDLERLTRSLIRLGRVDEAAGRLESVADPDRSVRLHKMLIESVIASGGSDRLALDLLGRLSSVPQLSPEDRQWVLARQARMLIEEGHVESAAAKLVREMQRLHGLDGSKRGELFVLLAEAVLVRGEPQVALGYLEEADRLLPADDPVRAELGEHYGEVALVLGDTEEARERFGVVVDRFSASEAMLSALFGLARTEALDGNHDLAVETFERLRAEMQTRPWNRYVNADVVTEELLRLCDQYMTRGEMLLESKRTALRYALVAGSMHRGGEVPEGVLLVQAIAYREIASLLTEQALGEEIDELEGSPGRELLRLDAATSAEIKEHLIAAGETFMAHATAIAGTDVGAWSSSVWSSADAFDRAGDLRSAETALLMFVGGASSSDPRLAQAKFRLGQVLRSKGEFAAAARWYKELIDASGTGEAAKGVGPWADRSVVPLAVCMLHDQDPSNDAEGVAGLLSTLEGGRVTPDAGSFREALVELADRYYATGRWVDAIERYEEAIDRYPDDPEIDAFRYKLADSYRLSASEIAEELGGSLRQDERDRLEQLRVDRLRRAIELYDRVREDLDEVDPRLLTDLRAVYLRNAYFYSADCAFDLGEYEAARASYDRARQRYQDEPSSLVALVQIVNSYVIEQRWEQARTANERARQHLRRFPDSVWDRPDLPMGREHWERWLDNTSLIDKGLAGAGSGGAAGSE